MDGEMRVGVVVVVGVLDVAVERLVVREEAGLQVEALLSGLEYFLSSVHN